MKIRQRMAAVAAVSVMLGGGVTVLTATSASAHGSPTSPGSRTYLCYTDGRWTGGDIQPRNPACADAVAEGGTQPLWDWFGVLRSDGAGRMEGFIPDGELCGAGTEKWSAYNAARDDWPATRLTSGANFTVRYNAWAPHPGQFRLFITKDSYDPTEPLKWSDLESEPFSTWNETTPNGNGEYYWDVTLPANKTGRHLIYSVWARTDSTETFYGCSDVVFDGGSGEVIGIPDGTTTTTTTTTAPATTTTTTAAATTTTTTAAATTTTTTSTSRPTTTTTTTSTSRPTTTTTTAAPTTTSSPAGGANSCTATYKVVGQWQSGFQGEVSVTNTGTSPLTSWNTAWTFANGQTVTQAWSADVTSSGANVTATNMAWNGSVGVGQSTTFGFLGSWNGTNSVPVVSCNGVTPGGTTSTTTVAPTTTTTTSTTTTTPPTSTTTTRPTTTTTTRPTTTTTTTSTGTGGSGSLLNDGFEAQTGTTPSLGWTTVTKDCSGTGTASIDSTVAHSGSKSLKVTGGVGYCNHVFVQAPVNPSDAGGSLYVRAYVRHTTALPPDHVTFIAMNDANDGNVDLRIGGQNSALQWNRQSDDATLPAQSPAGVALSAPLATDAWQCFEFKVTNSGLAQTWVNGNEIAGLTVDGTPTADVDQQWLARSWSPSLTNLRFGWESYGNGADTLWYDDIAVGSSRIGC